MLKKIFILIWAIVCVQAQSDDPSRDSSSNRKSTSEDEAPSFREEGKLQRRSEISPEGKGYVAALQLRPMHQAKGDFKSGGDKVGEMQDKSGKFGFALKVGYNFKPFYESKNGDVVISPGIEGEIMYAKVNWAMDSTLTRLPINFSSKLNVTNLSLNALMNFRLYKRFKLYGGVGAGVSYLYFDKIDLNYSTTTLVSFYADEIAALTGQGIIGGEIHFTPMISLVGEYKYLMITDHAFTLSDQNEDFSMSHGIGLCAAGIKFNF